MSRNPFIPAWWLPNPHLQTLWPAICRRSIKLPLERERLELPDGDFVDLDWLQDATYQKGNAPIILMLHGLEGSIESHYAKGMLKALALKGWRGVFMHFRGCSGEDNRLPRSYHSADTEDMKYIIKILREREPRTSIAAIGYSLGGNVLLKCLGETHSSSLLDAAIAVSVPFELQKAAQRIQHGFSQFYQWYFIRCLRERLSKKFKKVETPLDPEIIFKVSTMMEFDNHITAPLHGFIDAVEYYTIASSRQYLRNINVPTLIVHAKDDPFMTEDVIPNDDELSSKVELELTDSGGHVGFVSGKYPWSPQYWLETRVPEFLEQYL